jgi:predicted phage terminase large subunit-like protein
MTGDTPVLMASGVEKPLREIRPGDSVATFDKGKLSISKVNNWRSSGVDSIYQVKTQSGKILQANERHPFLVMNEGVLEWTRLKNLKPGDLLVSLKDAQDLQGQKPSLESVDLVEQKTVITAKTLKHLINRLGLMVSGRAKTALAVSRCIAKVCALNVTETNTPPLNTRQNKIGLEESSIDMASLWSSTRRWFKSVEIYVMYVVNLLRPPILVPIGMQNFVSTTVTTQERSEDCFAMTATSRSDTERRQMYLSELRRISDFTADPIFSITPNGEKEVFDVEIDRTENFIANGFVSHNTRWSKRDLTGQVIANSMAREGDEWEVIELPALLPSGKPLWPEFWKKEELEAIKAEIPVGKWEAQYQQNPTSEEGAIIKRDMWKIWEEEEPPRCEYIIQSWDTAFEKNNRADYSACTTWGVFYKTNEEGFDYANLVLLDAFKDRMEFPELKKTAYEMYRQWQPDTLIVEKKAAGAPLIYEMRKMGIPMSEYTPSKGSDKIARVNAISDLFASGLVWCPNKRWAEEVMEELASFPNGDHDDLVDSTSQALLRFRQGGFIQIPTDEDDKLFVPKKARYY